jgi:hypothetical protein
MPLPLRTINYDLSQFTGAEFAVGETFLRITPTLTTVCEGIIVPAITVTFNPDTAGQGTFQAVPGELGTPEFDYRAELYRRVDGGVSPYQVLELPRFRVPVSAGPFVLADLMAAGIPPAETTYWQAITQAEYEALNSFGTRSALGVWVASNTPLNGVVYTAAGLQYLGQTGATAIPDLPGLVPNGDWTPFHWGFSGNGTSVDTALFNAAIDACVAKGGGDLHVNVPGEYLTAETTVAASSWDNQWHIRIMGDGVVIRLAPGVTIKRADGQEGHVIKIGRRVGATIAVNGSGVVGTMGKSVIDGNRQNVGLPTDVDNHWQNIDISGGATACIVQGLTLRQAQYYGIGFQSVSFKNCIVRDLIIEDCGADGIDAKDNLGDSSGNICDNVTVRRFGLVATFPVQAGINIRSGWTVANFVVEEFSGDRHGVRDDTDASASFPLVIHSGVIRPGTVGTTIGFYSNIAGKGLAETQASKITAIGCAKGFHLRGQYAQYSNLRAINCDEGANFDTRIAASNVTVIDCTKGIVFSANNNNVRQFTARDCTTEIEFTGSFNRVDGGEVSGGTLAIVDSGSNNVIEAVQGIRTNSKVTGSVSIETTGVKNVVIAHGLDFTPSLANCEARFYRITAVSDFKVRPPVITAVDATNVVVQVDVDTASATAGATLGVSVVAVAKQGSRQ